MSIKILTAICMLGLGGCLTPLRGHGEVGIGYRPPGEIYVFSKADKDSNEAISSAELDLQSLTDFLIQWRELKRPDDEQADVGSPE